MQITFDEDNSASTYSLDDIRSLNELSIAECLDTLNVLSRVFEDYIKTNPIDWSSEENPEDKYQAAHYIVALTKATVIISAYEKARRVKRILRGET